MNWEWKWNLPPSLQHQASWSQLEAAPDLWFLAACNWQQSKMQGAYKGHNLPSSGYNIVDEVGDPYGGHWRCSIPLLPAVYYLTTNTYQSHTDNNHGRNSRIWDTRPQHTQSSGPNKFGQKSEESKSVRNSYRLTSCNFKDKKVKYSKCGGFNFNSRLN